MIINWIMVNSLANKIDHINREATIDFTGTAEKTSKYNAPIAVCHAVILYFFRTLVGKTFL